MASDIDSPRSEADHGLRWSGQWSLTHRILAVNIFALAMLAGSVFYLDGYRARLIDQRRDQYERQAAVMATALSAAAPAARPALVGRLGAVGDVRLRLYGGDGRRAVDSWQFGPATYDLRDPAAEPWRKHVARFLDRMIDALVSTPISAPFVEPDPDRRTAWPEAEAAVRTGQVTSALRLAPDLTPVFNAAAPLADRSVLVLTENARDLTRDVRQERFWSALLLFVVTALSVLLSLFLARTIALPLRRLARAAQQVRLGRAREVVVPRLPSRRDEIGLLARALSDMSQALRRRIDATEAFAADVTHELKNPLASLRSAVDTLARVSDPALQQQLLEVAQDDVRRLDRLITDIAEASRLDAELSRARFEPVDLGALIAALVAARTMRGIERGVRLAFARPRLATAMVMGEESRLARVIENLVDNAVSFSPDGGLVEVGATHAGNEVMIWVDDAGPGVPPAAREDIFRRFHSIRPEGEAFGRHSGLGLAIAKAIVEGHNGRIEVLDRNDAPSGARFLIRMAAA